MHKRKPWRCLYMFFRYKFRNRAYRRRKVAKLYSLMSFVQIRETAVSDCLSCASRMNAHNNLATITRGSPTTSFHCLWPLFSIRVIVWFDALFCHCGITWSGWWREGKKRSCLWSVWVNCVQPHLCSVYLIARGLKWRAWGRAVS